MFPELEIDVEKIHTQIMNIDLTQREILVNKEFASKSNSQCVLQTRRIVKQALQKMVAKD